MTVRVTTAPLAELFLQRLERREVGRTHRRARLHLESRNRAIGLAVLVHREFDRRKQPRCFLDFVEDDGTGEIPDEPGRVGGGEGERGGVIEGEVLGSPPGGHRLSQGSFARLPRAVEQHDWGCRSWPAARRIQCCAESWSNNHRLMGNLQNSLEHFAARSSMRNSRPHGPNTCSSPPAATTSKRRSPEANVSNTARPANGSRSSC